MECKNVIQDVVCRIKAIKGVEETYILGGVEEDKEKVLELEKKAEGAVLMGIGVGDNQGIKEVFKRQIIIAVTTPEKLEECKKCKDMMVMGNFVIYRNAVPEAKGSKERTHHCSSPSPEMS